MCEFCKKFYNVRIVSRYELQLVADEVKRSIAKKELLELPGDVPKPPYVQTENISVFEINEGEPVKDTILIKLKCVQCGADIKIVCDMFHGVGGIEFAEAN